MHGEFILIILVDMVNSTRQSGCRRGDVRLTNSDVDNEGDLEVCRFGVWGSICDREWSKEDSEVACRQLGFTTGNVRPLLPA